jgi:phenylalanyl-tRNA synthetase beta chain
MRVLGHNLRRDVRDVRIFEVGKVFREPQKGQFTDEKWSLGGLLAGKRWPDAWDHRDINADFYDLKGLIESLLGKLSIDKFHFLPYDEGGFYQPGCAAALMIGNNRCGSLGQMSLQVLSVFDINSEVFLFELDVAPLWEAVPAERRYEELPKFPAAERDLAIVVPEEVPASDVEEVIRQTGGQLVVSLRLFDLYRGKQIPSGKKGLAYSLRYQSSLKTLTDDEVADTQRDILKALGEKFGAELRES